MTPIPFAWDGFAMVPLASFRKRADAQFVIGERYILVEQNERSMRSHRHYFASVHEGWLNLPEHMAERFERLKENYPELTVRAPLIERGLTKASTLAMVERAGLVPPRSYAMGYPNANCLQTGCVKASSPNYWARYRQDFPDNFARTAGFAREIGARLARINGERVFIDDIPADWPTTDPIAPHCDFLCVLAEKDMEDAA